MVGVDRHARALPRHRDPGLLATGLRPRRDPEPETPREVKGRPSSRSTTSKRISIRAPGPCGPLMTFRGSSRKDEYPHEFSGGMRQRVMIAMALACRPKIIIADEPVTALDVMIQAQILELLTKLQKELDLSMILISHDLSVIAQTCNNVAIMYGGKIAEYGPAEEVFLDPQHPYTQGLLRSFPDIYGPRDLPPWIPGQPPNLLAPPDGCRFHERCPLAFAECLVREPPLYETRPGHLASCHLRAPST